MWLQGVQSLPGDSNIIDVCDRGADTFEFLEHAFHSGRRFVIRSSCNRSIHSGHGEDAARNLLHTFARTLPSLGEYTLKVRPKRIEQKPKRKGKKKIVQRRGREAVLCVSAAPILLRAPSSKNGEHGNAPLPLWIVRVWEADPPAGEEALEWFLLTNRPCGTADDRTAERRGHNAAEPSRTEPPPRRPAAKQRRASDVVSTEYVQVLSAWRHDCEKPDWKIHDFCFALARLGGHQNRKHDSHPGWLVLWRGWTHLQAMLDGIHALKKRTRCAET